MLSPWAGMLGAVEIRTDRLGLLVDQLDSSCEFARDRIAGLTDDEYLWEMAPGMWSVRRRGEAATSRTIGGGDWVLEVEVPEPDPPPLTTIAWRLGHLQSGMAGRYEWTFGGRSQPPDQVEIYGAAAEAVEQFWALMQRWRDAVNGLTDEQMDMIGFGQYPWGLDPELPFIGIVWWTNRELIHHTAEIALLRDLYRARH